VTDDDDEFTDADRARLTEAIKAERKLKAEAERKARDEKKRADDLESEKLSEDEKRTKRLAELEAEQKAWEQERREYRIEQAIGRLAPSLSLVDVETVLRLVDQAQITFDDNGIPTNVETVVKDLVKAKPFLAGKAAPAAPGGINAGDGTSSGPPPKLTAEELEAAKKAGMTPERYAAMKSVTTIDDWKKTQPAKAG
jgi:hypothetical protein